MVVVLLVSVALVGLLVFTNTDYGQPGDVVDADPRDAEVLMKGAQDSPLLVIGQREFAKIVET